MQVRLLSALIRYFKIILLHIFNNNAILHEIKTKLEQEETSLPDLRFKIQHERKEGRKIIIFIYKRGEEEKKEFPHPISTIQPQLLINIARNGARNRIPVEMGR